MSTSTTSASTSPAANQHRGSWRSSLPDGSVRQDAGYLSLPNGMAITADGATLLVAESHGNQITAYDIDHDSSLARPASVRPTSRLATRTGSTWTPRALSGTPTWETATAFVSARVARPSATLDLDRGAFALHTQPRRAAAAVCHRTAMGQRRPRRTHRPGCGVPRPRAGRRQTVVRQGRPRPGLPAETPGPALPRPTESIVASLACNRLHQLGRHGLHQDRMQDDRAARRYPRPGNSGPSHAGKPPP